MTVDLSEMRPCVALTFVDLVPYVYVNGAWLALQGGTKLVAGAPVDYTASFRFRDTSVPATVMFAVGDWTSPWVSAADMPRKLSALDFGANGEIGSFYGAYYSLLPEGTAIELEMPEFTKDGSALRLEDAKFSMTISNPVKDAWYTVFIAEKLTDTFKAAEDSAQFSADTPTFTLTIDADKPSLFARLHAGLGQQGVNARRQTTRRTAAVELRLDPRLLRAIADRRAVAPAAQRQRQRAHEHRLARARLAGEHVQSLAEHRLGRLDRGQVRDRQPRQHDVSPSVLGRGRARKRPRDSAAPAISSTSAGTRNTW